MAVRYTDISKGYNNKVMLKHVSFDVNVGDRLGIIGPNGVGKTTLLKITVGLVKQDTGEVKIYKPNSVAYYDQEQSDLDEKNQIIQEMWAHKPHGQPGRDPQLPRAVRLPRRGRLQADRGPVRRRAQPTAARQADLVRAGTAAAR